ncbi:PREDICTED: peroxisomal membrane protein PEX16 [Dinoponera quadriceps]|uniref:Peroxisomal membrane protein PEX16 n=1 Tax=Dinoponera quadriceps TaxID=609295 RepID=A0A6P3XIT9_DINQU|nr:PREDICTED: peroxisomal membrane protein PEX16 [Dinoponera quadriceps]
MTNSLKSKIVKLFETYKKIIVENPQMVSEIEVAIKWLSYFSVGHFNNSSLALEVIYSMPNLIMLSNDMLMYHSSSLHPKIPQYESKVKILLTMLEYMQTLLEAIGKKFGGEMGRWLIIAIVQLAKAILRLLLIYVYKERITKNPSVPPLNRKTFNKATDNLQLKGGFRLKRSGIVVRTVKYAEPVQLRTWKALPSDADENQNLSKNQWSDTSLKLAESLNVIKPLVYLGCISATSQRHWQPWLLSLLVDTTSLYIFSRCSRSTVFSKEENMELTSRQISLLLYILKSPFYEKYGRGKINALLDRISACVPLTSLLMNSLKRNLEYINSMYFYTS